MPAVLEILEKFVWQFITLFSEMAPFLLLGFLLAGILHVWVPNHLYVPKIAKPNFKSVLWAALFGGTFAILRPVAAFVTAMLGGVFTNLVTKNEPETGVAKKELRVEWHDEDDIDETALKKAVNEAGFEFVGKI